MKSSRALGTVVLIPWFTVACISGEDPQTPVASQGGNASVGGANQGGVIAGNQGGSRQATATTGTKNTGVGGGTSSNTGTVISGNVGGTHAAGTGGQSVGVGGSQSPGIGGQSAGIGGDTITAVGGQTGAGGTLSRSTAAPPTSGLGVYVDMKQGGIYAQSTTLYIFLDIVNTSDKTQNLSSVTMRYWYVDDGWGSSTLVMEPSYVSIGNNNIAAGGTVKYDGSFAVTPSQTGADHYFEFSLGGTLAASGDQQSNDKFHIQVRIHDSGYVKGANVENDYSPMTITGYDDRITLYSGGQLIWGVEPGGSANGGAGGASSVGGASAIGGTTSGTSSSGGGTLSTGGVESTGGIANSGGAESTGGDAATGGLASSGGVESSGGLPSTGGQVSTGGESSAGGQVSTGGDSSSGGLPSTVADASVDQDASIDGGIASSF